MTMYDTRHVDAQRENPNKSRCNATPRSVSCVLEKASALLGHQRAHGRYDVVRQVVFIDSARVSMKVRLDDVPGVLDAHQDVRAQRQPVSHAVSVRADASLTSSVLCARVVHDESAGRSFDARHKTAGSKRQEHLARSSLTSAI